VKPLAYLWKKIRRAPLWTGAGKFLSDPRRQLVLAWDSARTRSSTAFLRRHPWPAPDQAKTLFVITVGEWVYAIKTEIMLALGMRLAGWKVVFLVHSRNNVLNHRYLGHFGFRDLVYWEDFQLEAREEEEILQEAGRLMEGELTFPGIKEWTYRGCWIGPQILASVSRLIHRAAFNAADPQIRETIRRTLVEALRCARRAERLYQHISPDAVIVNEPNYAANAPLVDGAIAKGAKVIHFVQPARDDGFYLWVLNSRTRRSHPGSVSAETFAQVLAAPWTAAMDEALTEEFSNRYGGRWYLQRRNQAGVRDQSREEIVARFGFDPEKKLAVVFSHVLWDANLFYGTDLFEDYGHWLVETVRAAAANSRVNWVIKTHPANVWKLSLDQQRQELAEEILIRERIGVLPPHVRLLPPDCDLSVNSLFHSIDYAITVRGTVGIEFPCFGIPVLTAGTGRYSDLGITIDSASRGEYLDRLATIERQPPLDAETILRAKKHAYAAFRLRPWIVTSFRSRFRNRRWPGDPLDHDARLTVRSIRELCEAEDLRRWAAWVESGTSPDYIDDRLLGRKP